MINSHFIVLCSGIAMTAGSDAIFQNPLIIEDR